MKESYSKTSIELPQIPDANKIVRKQEWDFNLGKKVFVRINKLIQSQMLGFS
jgi:hypothetical protein